VHCGYQQGNTYNGLDRVDTHLHTPPTYYTHTYPPPPPPPPPPHPPPYTETWSHTLAYEVESVIGAINNAAPHRLHYRHNLFARHEWAAFDIYTHCDSIDVIHHMFHGIEPWLGGFQCLYIQGSYWCLTLNIWLYHGMIEINLKFIQIVISRR